MLEIYWLRSCDFLVDPLIAAPDWALSELGWQQAKSLVNILNQLGSFSVVTSEYLRAKQTIQPWEQQLTPQSWEQHLTPQSWEQQTISQSLEQQLSASAAPVITTCSALNEQFLSPDFITNCQEVAYKCWHEPDYHLPGGESAAQALARVRAWLNQELDQCLAAKSVLAVTHGNLLGLILQAEVPGFSFADWQKLPVPSLWKFSYDIISKSLMKYECLY